MPPLKVMLDTNACEKIGNPVFGLDRERIERRIQREFQVVVSPQTVIEILKTVKGAKNEAHFESSRQRLRILVGNSAADFLRFPGSFALHTVLGFETARQEYSPADFGQWVRIVLAAKNMPDLIECRVQLNDDATQYGLNLPLIEEEETAGISRHRGFLGMIASKAYRFPTPVLWAQEIARHLECPITHEQCGVLAERLSAAYEYDKSTFRIVSANPNYSIAGHDSDRMDKFQLFYLCDPDICILTDDGGIKKMCASSIQADRILALRDF